MALFIGSQVASTMVMSVTADKTQQRIMLLLPLFFACADPELPRRPDPLLDHDQLLDARAAARWCRRIWPPPVRRPWQPRGAPVGRAGATAATATVGNPRKPPPPPAKKKRRRR
jgi:hypothetical protein